MSDVWLAEVNADNIAIVGHSPNPVFDGYSTLAARLLVANDGTDAGPAFPFDSVQSLGIIVGVEDNFFGGGPTYEWQAYAVFVQKPFPSSPFNTWFEILRPNVIPSPSSWSSTRIRQADGNNGAAYFGGGVLSIQKDYAGGQYVFTTPVGSLTAPFNWFDNQPPFPFLSWVPSDSPLYAAGIGAALAYADDSVANSGRVDWYNFYTRKNGVIVDGAALSAADPGVFDLPFTEDWHNPPGGGNYHLTSVLMPSSSSQQTNRWRSLFSISIGQDYAATDEQRYTMPPVSGFFGLDLTTMPEHDVAFGIWQMSPATLIVRRSHDHGATWVDFTVSTTGLAMSPSIQCFAGQVWICYDNGTNIVTRKSLDLGLSWSTAMPVSITGTNPRLVIAPDGTFFYFYITSGNIVLSRSANLGSSLLDASPLIVASGVSPQDFGAVLGADRGLLVSYTNAGSWVSRRSVDWGLDWFTL